MLMLFLLKQISTPKIAENGKLYQMGLKYGGYLLKLMELKHLDYIMMRLDYLQMVNYLFTTMTKVKL